MPSLGDKDKIVQLLEKQKWLTPNNNLLEPVPQWLPYLEYNNVCIMVKIIFEFYLQYSKLLIPNDFKNSSFALFPICASVTYGTA